MTAGSWERQIIVQGLVIKGSYDCVATPGIKEEHRGQGTAKFGSGRIGGHPENLCRRRMEERPIVSGEEVPALTDRWGNDPVMRAENLNAEERRITLSIVEFDPLGLQRGGVATA